MSSYGMLRSVTLVRTDVSEDRSASICVCRLLITADVPSAPILVTLMMEAIRSSETSVLTRVTRSYIPEDVILRVYFCSRNFITLTYKLGTDPLLLIF
jgi:hypothetical protein